MASVRSSRGATSFLWMGTELRFAPPSESQKEKHTGEHEKPGFLRWCEMDFVRPQYGNPVWMVQGTPKGNQPMHPLVLDTSTFARRCISGRPHQDIPRSAITFVVAYDSCVQDKLVSKCLTISQL